MVSVVSFFHRKIETEEELVSQLTLHLDPVNENAETENILFAYALVSGKYLTKTT